MPFSDLTPGNEIAGGTDGTPIGNIGDKLKVSGDFTGTVNEVINDTYVSGAINITNVQVEAKVGLTRLPGRKVILIYNSTGQKVYYGASGVTKNTGILLDDKQFVSLPFGDNIPLYLIMDNNGIKQIRIQEAS